jgi:hypothetical protein
MNKELNVTYHEVDFILPAHRFNIQFSYVTKKGLPFVREFLLRLIHITPMSPVEIATYFGFSKRELDEALTDLVEKGDLAFSESGKIELTSNSRGYFVGLGSTPLVSLLVESGGIFAFELASFNCLGRKRTNEKWMPGLQLEIANETVANSERIAKKKFQEQFHKIQEKGFWEHKSSEEKPERPSIYTMEVVEKLGQEPIRLTCYLSIDPDGIPVERSDFDMLDDSSAVQELITDAIVSAQKPMNLKQVAHAMGALEDHETKTLFNQYSINVPLLLDSQQLGKLSDGAWVPFLGPLYSQGNWQLISDFLGIQLAAIQKTVDRIEEMLWIAPSDGYWGQSVRTASVFSELIDRSTTKGKNPVRLYDPKLYLPVRDSEDKQAILRWKQEFSEYNKHVFGLVEGFLDGNVEVLLLPGYMAVVSYHISKPENLPVSLPIGYVTTDKNRVEVVTKLVKDYLNGMISFNNPRNLGALEKIDFKR